MTARTHLHRWFVILSAALFCFCTLLTLQMFNSTNIHLIIDSHFTNAQLLYLPNLYIYTTLIFLFPAGILLDRLSTRGVLLTAVALSLIGTLGFAVSTYFWQAALCYFIVGFANAFYFLSCLRLASRWFPAHKLAFVIGIIFAIVMASNLLTQTSFALLHLPWRTVIFIYTGFGIFIGLLILLNVQDYPASYAAQHSKQIAQLKNIGYSESLSLTLCNPQNWLAGIYASLLNLPVVILCCMLWGNLYLQQIHHISAEEATNVISITCLGALIGAPIIGAWSDHICLRKFPMIIGAMLSTIAILVFIEFHYLNYESLLVLFFFIGFFTSTQILAYPTIIENNNRINTSTPIGLAALLVILIAVFFQSVFGHLMSHCWTGIILNGMNIYSNQAFQHAMLLLPVGLVLAILCTCFLDETRCQEFNSANQTRT